MSVAEGETRPYPIWLQFRVLLRKVVEEVVAQDARDAYQQLRVAGLPGEDFVDVGSGIAELGGEPRDGASLVGQYLLDSAAYVHGAIC